MTQFSLDNIFLALNWINWLDFNVIVATPILTRRLTMRAETIRALEVRKNSVMAERRKSAMQTLGAKNDYGIAASVNVSAGKYPQFL